MEGHDGIVEVRLIGAPNTRDAKAHLLACGLSPGVIAEVAGDRDEVREPLLLGSLFGNDHDDVTEHVLGCLRELEASGAEFTLLLEGEVTSRDELFNALEQWLQIKDQVKRQDQRRYGTA